MIADTIKKIDAKTGENKTELLNLLATLESEITKLAKAEGEHAESIACIIERSTHEAIRQEKNPGVAYTFACGARCVGEGLRGVTSAPRRGHQLLSTVLANMGI